MSYDHWDAVLKQRAEQDRNERPAIKCLCNDRVESCPLHGDKKDGKPPPDPTWDEFEDAASGR